MSNEDYILPKPDEGHIMPLPDEDYILPKPDEGHIRDAAFEENRRVNSG
jgi:hypothetical protein